MCSWKPWSVGSAVELHIFSQICTMQLETLKGSTGGTTNLHTELYYASYLHNGTSVPTGEKLISVRSMAIALGLDWIVICSVMSHCSFAFEVV
jgi:hypothetical protein